MSEDPKPDKPNGKDSLWDDFENAESADSKRLDEMYKIIEDVNADKIEFTASGIMLTNLMLRPDTERELHHQNNEFEYSFVHGNPYTIFGELSPRTQKLIENMLTKYNAVKDDQRSTEEREVWVGEFNGKKVEIFKVHDHYASNNKKYDDQPTFYMQAATPNRADSKKSRRDSARKLLRFMRRRPS